MFPTCLWVGDIPSGYFYLLGGQPHAGPDVIEPRTPNPGKNKYTPRRDRQKDGIYLDADKSDICEITIHMTEWSPPVRGFRSVRGFPEQRRHFPIPHVLIKAEYPD